MSYGFWGRILWVDLSEGKIWEEELPESIYRRFLGGYGLGVAVLYERMPPNAEPLGSGNILGFIPGLLTGSGAPFSGRFMVVARSPLTGGWGEANCGGNFGPALRGAGYDGLFITGTSPRPVYLVIDGRRAELRDASDLWGLDSVQTEEAIRRAFAQDARVACIGPAGELLSLISGIVNDGGRLAARCGLGAVMGAKRLKAIAVRGKERPPLADPGAFRAASSSYLRIFRRRPSRWVSLIPAFLLRSLPVMRRLRIRASGGPTQFIVDSYRRYGTTVGLAPLVELGDTPVRNWLGIGFRDFPLSKSSKLSDEAAIRYNIRAYGCHSCPVACGALARFPDGQIGHRPEYETLAAFGPLLLNDDLEAVMRCTDICNRAGLDTISTGVVVAFAIEARERGWLPPELAEELPLRWGDGEVIVELVKRIARREPGLGNWLADGVWRAAQKLGPEAQEAAMHAGGQELPMHRGIYEPGVALGYYVDPAPGRHTSTQSGITDIKAYAPYFALKGVRLGGRYDYSAKGPAFAVIISFLRAYDSLGLCHFALQMGNPPVLDWVRAATGWDLDEAEFLRIGWRIQVLRHSFNAREGLPARFPLPGRELGDPPQEVGPVAGVTIDIEAMASGYFSTLGIDPETGMPLPETIAELGLESFALERR
ncbi:MAG: aldehyde ferredoxin oxidoreductase family protein [Anaerolineae bacterium]|nr:aldehyde ferredoxin oxidoreductase family protein [Anaerolineae bacterium]MDW8101254.1 aldehyde ferredoxin oxidoreductase family protein [Anaerolineae bacterium]